jgi:endonuclease III
MMGLAHADPYTLLIATLLSARCTDKCVNKVTPKLFALADTPKKMILLTPETIRAIVRPCGLSKTKSHAIWKLSQILIEKFHGEVPKSLADLETLPGVGHKTASVVVSQAFGQDAFPVDTHVHRLAKLWKLSEAKNVRQTESDLKRLFPPKNWRKLHLQMIAYGRVYGRGKELIEYPEGLFFAKSTPSGALP